MKAGVIGLGRIGGGVAQCLARAGLLGAVYDIVPTRVTDLALGMANSTSPRAVAESCDVVLMAVFDAAQARAAMTGPDGLLAAARPELSLVIQSTISPEDYRELRSLAAESGVELLDCGVSGGSGAAQNGLVSLVGGSAEAVARVRPILEGYSSGVFHMGEAGAGLAAKLARNVIVYAIWRAEHEGFELAKAAGVSVPNLVAAIELSLKSSGPPCTWARRDKVDGTVEMGDDYREYLTATLRKDLDAAFTLADTLDVDMPATRIAFDTARTITGLEPPVAGGHAA